MDHLRLEMFIFLDEAGHVEKHVGTLEIMYVKAQNGCQSFEISLSDKFPLIGYNMTYFLVIQSCTGAVNHVHLFRRRTFPVTFNALLDMVPSLTTCTFSRSIGVFTRRQIQQFAIFCDHLSRPLIWREFPFHTSLACSETDRHQCHLIYINPCYLSPFYLCTRVLFHGLSIVVSTRQ